jgi:hypothetical protein
VKPGERVAIDGFERLEDGIPVTANHGQTSDGSGSSAGFARASSGGGSAPGGVARLERDARETRPGTR